MRIFLSEDTQQCFRKIIHMINMEDTKKLGFGLMRLPRKGLAIDIEQSKKMVDLFLDAGFTYFDA